VTKAGSQLSWAAGASGWGRACAVVVVGSVGAGTSETRGGGCAAGGGLAAPETGPEARQPAPGSRPGPVGAALRGPLGPEAGSGGEGHARPL